MLACLADDLVRPCAGGGESRGRPAPSAVQEYDVHVFEQLEGLGEARAGSS
jgi:hypothetical protein